MKTAGFLLLLLQSLLVFGQQNPYESPAGTKFLLYTPPSYSTGSQTHPLLISLHSKGEVGDDLAELTSKNPEQMPSRLIYLNRWPKELPFIVLTPQLRPSETDPDPQWPADYIDEVVRYVVANYRVDLNRIYLTGISRGGTGAWTYASAYPHKIAAMVPISGRSDLAQACPIKNIPIWAFHGDGDRTAPPAYSIDMVTAIYSCQPSGRYKPRLNIMHARGHNGWSEIYNGTNGYRIYDWLLKFTKSNISNTAPYVNAGIDRQILVRSEPLHVRGDFFDSEGTITAVQWKQTAGIALTLSNTTSEFLKITNLKAGTFEFELTVTDNNGAQSSDRVVIKISESIAAPAVTRLVLMNGKTNTAIGDLGEGQIINTRALNLTEINIQAIATTDAASVRFSVNTDQHTRTINSSLPYFIKTQTTAPEWEIKNGEYLICATPYGSTNAGGTQGISQCYKVTVTDGLEPGACDGVGKIEREVWSGVPGLDVSDIPITTAPTSKSQLTLFESPTNIGDNYGARIRGFICPPVSGNYFFWIASDDKSELWLSTDEHPANKIKIAGVTGHTGVRQWTRYASQQSAAVHLQAGKKYYIEALHKEASGGDNLAVGWQLPDGSLERPIPGSRLMMFEMQEEPVAKGTIVREEWTGIAGYSVSDIPLDMEPSSTRELVIFESPSNIGSNYGARIRGFVWPPANGDYIFWIASDDRSELWLSTDDHPENKTKIAFVNAYTGIRQWTRYASQQSVPITLQAGKKYYIEALHKEASGGDNLAVGWQLADGILERPIPGNRLSPIMPASPSARMTSSAGVQENLRVNNEEEDLSIYPNPLKANEHILTVKGLTKTTDSNHAVITIVATTGKTVFRGNLVCEQFCEVRLNKTLTPGVYLVYGDTGGQRFTKRLVVF